MTERPIYQMPEHLKGNNKIDLQLEKLQPGECQVILPAEGITAKQARNYAIYQSKKLGRPFKVRRDKEGNIFVYREEESP